MFVCRAVFVPKFALLLWTVGPVVAQAQPGEVKNESYMTTAREVTADHSAVSDAMAEALEEGQGIAEAAGSFFPKAEELKRLLSLQSKNLETGHIWLGLNQLFPFHAMTRANWCSESPNPIGADTKRYRYDPKEPGNYQRYPWRDFPEDGQPGEPGGKYCPRHGQTGADLLGPSAGALAKRLVLCSALLHEGVHCSQGKTNDPRPDPPPVPDPEKKDWACREIEAYELQIEFLLVAVLIKKDQGQLSADDEKAIDKYFEYLAEYIKKMQDIKKANGG